MSNRFPKLGARRALLALMAIASTVVLSAVTVRISTAASSDTPGSERAYDPAVPCCADSTNSDLPVKASLCPNLGQPIWLKVGGACTGAVKGVCVASCPPGIDCPVGENKAK